MHAFAPCKHTHLAQWLDAHTPELYHMTRARTSDLWLEDGASGAGVVNGHEDTRADALARLGLPRDGMV